MNEPILRGVAGLEFRELKLQTASKVLSFMVRSFTLAWTVVRKPELVFAQRSHRDPSRKAAGRVRRQPRAYATHDQLVTQQVHFAINAVLAIQLTRIARPLILYLSIKQAEKRNSDYVMRNPFFPKRQAARHEGDTVVGSAPSSDNAHDSSTDANYNFPVDEASSESSPEPTDMRAESRTTSQGRALPNNDSPTVLSASSLDVPALCRTHRTGSSMPVVPEYVTQAIQNYQPPEGFTKLPKRRGERSLILDWGVRVSCHVNDKVYMGWICMGSRSCQRDSKIIQLYGNTSKATKHLTDFHRESSSKSLTEQGRKRSRQHEINRIADTIANTDDSRRMTLLLETLRIVRNNLPFCFGEYEESELIADLVVKEEFRATINRQTVSRAITELYDSSRRAASNYIVKNRIDKVASLSMVVDFWSCKSQPGTKFLGLRVYLVDEHWMYRSILLGTRRFEPLYRERCEGYRTPFKRWIIEILQNFGLNLANFYGSTTDAGPDVKWMMRSGLCLKWIWCVSHLTNAATKTAFGIAPQRSASKNPELTDLISRIAKTIYAIRSNDSMGSLFAELCQQLQPDGTTQLLAFKEHRFMGLTRVIRRILEKWAPLEHWFEERRAKAIRARKDPPHDFPLIEDKATLTQLLALLDPITTLNIRAQSECANQVEVLLNLYRLRLSVLDETTGVKDRLQPPNKTPFFYRVHELTPTVKKVRHLLADAFHKHFFSRYTDRAKMRETSFILEAQMCLHPVFKNPERGLTKIVRICSSQLIIDRANPHLRVDEQTVQRNVDKVKEYVRKCVVSLMLAIAVAEADTQQSSRANSPPGMESMFTIPPPIAVYSEELTDMFGEHPAQREQSSGHEGRVDEEYDRWLTDIVTLERKVNGEVESILEFWKRQEETNTYHYLPRVARILFAVPSSSAAIERDFGVSGMMTTTQRTSLANHNIEMCSFLNRNREFTDVTQCKILTEEEYANAVPTNMLVALEPSTDEHSISPEWELQVLASFWDDNAVAESKDDHD